MRKFLFLLFFQAFVCGLFAQNVEFRQANFPNNTKKEFNRALKNKKMGEKTMKAEDYRRAVDFLLKAYEFNPKNAELNYEISNCYEHLRLSSITSATSPLRVSPVRGTSRPRSASRSARTAACWFAEAKSLAKSIFLTPMSMGSMMSTVLR